MQSRVRFNKVPEKVLEKVWEAFVQSQVRFNRVPEKEALVQSQVRFNRVPEKVLEKVWEALVERLSCRTRSSSTGFAAILFTETQLRCLQPLASQHASERFVKIKRCGCWGYHRS